MRRRVGALIVVPIRGGPGRGRRSSASAPSIDPDDHRALELSQQAQVGHPVPRVGLDRLGALALVALEEARHEELSGQGGEHHPAGLAVVDRPLGVVGVDELEDGARVTAGSR